MRRLPALLLVPLLLSACTGGGDDAASTAAGEAAAGAGGGVALDEQATDGGSTGSLPPLASVALAGEAVVRTAELDVRVDDVRRAADRAAVLAREAGGGVVSERADLQRGGATASAEVVLRVPPERLDAVLVELADLGEERGRVVTSEEVGDQLVDLEARLAAQRASVDRVRALLAEATDLAQVVQVEGELTRRTADLESLQARVAALRDRIDLSTVTLRLAADDAPGAAGGLPGFLDGLRGGWAALLAVGAVTAATAGALLPFTPLALLAGWAALRARRRRVAVA
jgi:hypothetical protein